MKTPEQMAEEYCSTKQLSHVERLVLTSGFLAGYQAAKDQLADAGKVMDTCEHILHMEKMVNVNSPEKLDSWISVKERLPEFDVWCVWWSFDQRCENGIGRREVGDSLDWWSDYDYWCELPKLPEAPKGEK